MEFIAAIRGVLEEGMDSGVLVSIIGLAINVTGMIIGAVWCVGKLSSQADVLNNSLQHLDRTTIDLMLTMRRLDDKIDDHDRRIAVVEDRMVRSARNQERSSG